MGLAGHFDVGWSWRVWWHYGGGEGAGASGRDDGAVAEVEVSNVTGVLIAARGCSACKQTAPMP